MQEYQQRVVTEKTELDTKREALNKFLVGNVIGTLPEEDRSLLFRQAEAMTAYSFVLGDRIARFNTAELSKPADDGFGDTKLGAPACQVGEPCESCQ